MIDYLFEEASISTTILMDEGSNASFITTKLAEALHLKGRFKLTKILKAGEEAARPVTYKHHTIELNGINGKVYKLRCIEVPFITSVQEQPNLEGVQNLFPSLPKGSIKRPNMEV